MRKTSRIKLSLLLMFLLLFSLLVINGPVVGEETVVNDKSTLETVGEHVYKEEPGFQTMSATPDEYFTYTISDGEAEITAYSSDGPKDIVIPETLGGYPVTSIIDGVDKYTDQGVFSGMMITSVEMPDSLTSIGEWAFNSNQLTEVTIPDSVTSIGQYAFLSNRLTEVTIGNSVTSIGDQAFHNNQLTEVTIPNSVTVIGTGAFGSNQLTQVTIPDSVTGIGAGAFASNQLTEVIIPDSVTSIGNAAFRNNQLTQVTIPDSVEYLSGFSDNQLTEVVIPDSVTSIGGSAFFNNQLTEVTIPDSVTSIGYMAFPHNQLTEVTIGNSVTSISGYAFYYNHLTEITIPDSVTSIGYMAFEHNQLTEVTIQGKNITIQSRAFTFNQSEPTDLTIFGVEGSNSEIYANDNNHTFVAIPETIYTITINSSENGTISSNKTEASTGDLILLTISPDEGYELEELKINGETKISTANTYAFNMLSENIEVDASFLTLVKSITVTGTDGFKSIETTGGTLQMLAEVLPENVANKNVTWSVEPGTGSATITQDGLLSAISNGRVIVKATAQDGSGVEGSAEITITNQFATKYFGSNTVVNQSVKQTNDNGFITVGTYVRGNWPDKDYAIVVNKYNSDGVREWRRVISEGGFLSPIISFQGFDIVETADGGFILVGSRSFSIYIAKLDYSGKMVWDRYFGGGLYQKDKGASITSIDDGYILLSNSINTATSVKRHYSTLYTMSETGGKNIYINNFFDYIGTDIAKSINDKGYLINGFRITDKYGYHSEEQVIKINELFEVEWKLEGIGIQMVDGVVIANGSTLTKYDFSRNKIWETTLAENVTAISKTSDNGIIVGHNQNLTKISPDGNKVWSTKLTGTRGEIVSVEESKNGYLSLLKGFTTWERRLRNYKNVNEYRHRIALTKIPLELYYQSVSLTAMDTVELTFSKDIFNALNNLEALKNTVEFSPDGENFRSLQEDETIEISGNKLIITFAEELAGDKNKIRLAAGSLKDADGNTLEDKEVTETFDASVVEECFIATATYGSRMEPGVVLLRQFRDKKLLTNMPGQAFVSFYYSVSPGIAEYIAGSALLKAVTQVLLLPVVAVAYLLLHPALLYTLLLLFLAVYAIKRRRMAMF